MKTWTSPHGRTLPNDFSQRTLLMGIVNVTPDSFSDGGEFYAPEQAAEHACQLVKDGADIIDLGAESTRPGSHKIDAKEELKRLLPAIEKIRSRLPQIPLSIDTYRPEVAKEAIAAGADILNDVCAIPRAGTQEEYAMGKLAAKLNCPLIAMHNRFDDANYKDFWKEFMDDLRAGIKKILDCGLPKEQLWLDPGFGFGKTPQQNLQIVAQLRDVCKLGFPVLLGTSRKSTLGILLGGKTPKERKGGDDACSAIGVFNGAAALRLHDVAAHRDNVIIAKEILNNQL